jgi:hypothetical protein
MKERSREPEVKMGRRSEIIKSIAVPLFFAYIPPTARASHETKLLIKHPSSQNTQLKIKAFETHIYFLRRSESGEPTKVVSATLLDLKTRARKSLKV